MSAKCQKQTIPSAFTFVPAEKESPGRVRPGRGFNNVRRGRVDVYIVACDMRPFVRSWYRESDPRGVTSPKIGRSFLFAQILHRPVAALNRP